jgi:hypothetical protein
VHARLAPLLAAHAGDAPFRLAVGGPRESEAKGIYGKAMWPSMAVFITWNVLAARTLVEWIVSIMTFRFTRAFLWQRQTEREQNG